MVYKAPSLLGTLTAAFVKALKCANFMLRAQIMKTLNDPGDALASGLAAIRTQFQVPSAFPDKVEAAALAASQRRSTAHVDRTNQRFVTLDPATSTDLDQAFWIERAGADLILHYAIADVGWFVDDGDVIDAEAWARGTTLYLPDGKASLYPKILSEGGASLLPGGPRPAVIFAVRVDAAGLATLDGAERAVIVNHAKLAYDSVAADDLPAEFADFADRIASAERGRGAARVDPPEQEVTKRDDGYELLFRPRLLSEARNAALSLAANLAIADALQAHRTGLFRVMDEPDARAISRLRITAKAIGIDWPTDQSLAQFERRLIASDAAQGRMMLAIRRAGTGASYTPYADGVIPWHAAMGATYAHATAPLRRLADRYVVRAALAIANGQALPDAVTQAFAKLPRVMARADALSGQIDRAVIDLAEAVMLAPRVGQQFAALVTDVDERGARIQLCDMPVVARVDSTGLSPGAAVNLTLIAADPEKRLITFKV